MKAVLVWFRRNIRLDDNLPLHMALEAADSAVPVFVLDDFYLANDYSPPRLAVLGASIQELDSSLKAAGSRLIIRKGPADEALVTLARETGAEALFAPLEHEPHAVELQQRVERRFRTENLGCQLVDDYLLVPPGALRNSSGKPFTVYTPFSKKWIEHQKLDPVPAPSRIPAPPAILSGDFPSIPVEKPRGFQEKGAPRNPRGGSIEGMRCWRAFLTRAIHEYASSRDRLDLPGTSRISPHLRFGTIGIRRVLSEAREAWKSQGEKGRHGTEVFIKEIAWREFYAHLFAEFPETATENFRKEFDSFPWVDGTEEEKRFSAWAEGRTGYPVVDAAMRQLLEEGWMHNRARMIAASFLTKDLLVHWRRGEVFFRRHLADADPASNAGGWQWSAGTGTDAQPFFRIFNPTLQGKKFDPDGTYVKRYIPELARWWKPGRPIHSPWESEIRPPGYPAPIVDHYVARDRALAAFSQIKKEPQESSGSL